MYALCVRLRLRLTPMGQKTSLTALVTLCHAKMAGSLDRWSPKGLPEGCLNTQIQ